MLTKNQLNQLAQDFQIDTFSLFREYLQLVFLNYLYQEKQAEKIYFKGGTALRLLYNSPRFSEDLDFSTALSKKVISDLLKRIINKMQKEISGIKLVFIWQGKKSLRYRIRYEPEEYKYPLAIRIDFSLEKPLLLGNVSQIGTKVPVNSFALVIHLKPEEILAEKIRAFLMRGKGRDMFDLWYLLERKTLFKIKILEKKLKAVDRTFDQEGLLKKIEKYPAKRLESDLGKFLPKNYRKIVPFLKKKILEKWTWEES